MLYMYVIVAAYSLYVFMCLYLRLCDGEERARAEICKCRPFEERLIDLNE